MNINFTAPRYSKRLKEQTFSTSAWLKFVLAMAALSSLLMAKVLYASETPNHGLSTASAVEITLRDNPSLAQMQARYEAMLEVPAQAGALPDPTLSLNAMNFPTDSFDREQEAMTQLQIGLSQQFPFPGKRVLREEAAEFEAKAAGYSVAEMQLQLASAVRKRWWQLYYLDHALATVDNNRALLRQFISVAKTKYETGEGLQQDVLLAQLELSKLIDQEIQLQSIRRQQAIQFNILMDRSPRVPVVLADKVSKQLPALTDESLLYEKALQTRPVLHKMASHIDAAQSRLDLAKRDYYPDFTVGMSYGDRTGDNPLPRGGERSDFLSLMLAVKIPLYTGRKQSKAVSQKSLELQGDRYALQDEQGQVMADISSAVTDYQRASEQFRLFESGILPQARQTVESMLAGYQVNQVDFLNLVRSQVTLFNYELQYWKALSDAKQALARLQAAVGEEGVYE